MALNKETNNFKIINYLDYLSYLSLEKYKDKMLLIEGFSEDMLLCIFEKILQNLIFNKKKVLIISSDFLNVIKDNKIIKLIKGKEINLTENINLKKYLREQILNLPELTGKTYISKVDVISRRINRKIDIITNFIKLLHDKDENNLSLLEKYNITYKKLSKYDYLYNYYKRFRIKKALMDYSYRELKNAKEKIINSNIVDEYLRYRRYIDNSMFKVLKEDINIFILKEALVNLKKLNNRENLQITLINSKYKQDFLDNYFVNQNMKEEDVDVLANIVNIKFNSELIKKKEKKSFFKFFNRKIIDNEYENKLNEFKNIENDIKKEYISNLNSLNYYINEVIFLKDILKEEEYNALIKNYISGEDIKEKLEAYEKIVNISINIRETINYINTLDKIILDILDYSYSNLEYKDEMMNLISNLDYLKLHYEIENTEVLNKDLLENSNKYESLLSEIKNDLKIKDDLIKNSLNLVWNNVIREKLQISKLTKEKIEIDNEESYNDLFPCIITDLSSLYRIENFRKYLINFEKIIIFDKELEDEYLNFIKDINLKEKIILFLREENICLKDLKYKELHRLREDLDELENNFKTKCIIQRNESFMRDLCKFIRGLGYSFIQNYKIGIYNIPILINDIKLKKKIAILLDGDISKLGEYVIIDDLYIKDELNANNIESYRIWTRDIWLNKVKSYDKLEEFLKTKLVQID